MAETGNGGIKPGSGSMKTSNQATTMLTHTGGEDFEYGQWNEIWLDLSRTDVSGGSNVVDDLHWHVYYSDETTPVHIDWDHMFVTEESFTRHYFHNDYLGSARLMTDEGGDIVWARDYRPYGDERNNSGNDDNPYKFTGKERDEEIGLDYSWHRYYDYDLGRFTQIDPMFAKYPSLSPYQYAANNPLRFVDPNGLEMTSERIDNPDGSITYNMHYTATLQNQSSQSLTQDQMNHIAQLVQNEIEAAGTGATTTSDGKSITYNMTADIKAGGDLRPGDNQFAIVDPKVDAATGLAVAGESRVLSDRQTIMPEGNSDWQIARSGAHEIGHGMGLHEANTLNYNLMQQSYLGQGTMINAGQLTRINDALAIYNAGRAYRKSDIIP